MISNETEIVMPATKAITLWAVVGVASWADAASFAAAIASFLAAFYSVLLISEWAWKKIWRPIFEAIGWIKPQARRLPTIEEFQKLLEEEANR
jgi:hypothetical protein